MRSKPKTADEDAAITMNEEQQHGRRQGEKKAERDDATTKEEKKERKKERKKEGKKERVKWIMIHFTCLYQKNPRIIPVNFPGNFREFTLNLVFSAFIDIDSIVESILYIGILDSCWAQRDSPFSFVSRHCEDSPPENAANRILWRFPVDFSSRTLRLISPRSELRSFSETSSSNAEPA